MPNNCEKYINSTLDFKLKAKIPLRFWRIRIRLLFRNLFKKVKIVLMLILIFVSCKTTDLNISEQPRGSKLYFQDTYNDLLEFESNKKIFETLEVYMKESPDSVQTIKNYKKWLKQFY